MKRRMKGYPSLVDHAVYKYFVKRGDICDVETLSICMVALALAAWMPPSDEANSRLDLPSSLFINIDERVLH
jgi:hypothetical protein